jgi:aminopeptidase N
MKAQDKAKPVSITVKLHPEVLRLAQALGEFYNDSDVDHILSEAIKDAARDKKFSEWLEKHPDAGRPKEEIAEVKVRRGARKPEAAA